MSQGVHRGGQGSNIYVSEFLNKLKALGGDMSKLDDREIFHPEGYASKIVENLNLKGVQLRRFYSEIRNIYDRLQEGKKREELRYHLYKLYAITQYQENRGVIRKEFGVLVRGVVAYSKKES